MVQRGGKVLPNSLACREPFVIPETFFFPPTYTSTPCFFFYLRWDGIALLALQRNLVRNLFKIGAGQSDSVLLLLGKRKLEKKLQESTSIQVEKRERERFDFSCLLAEWRMRRRFSQTVVIARRLARDGHCISTFQIDQLLVLSLILLLSVISEWFAEA